MPRALVDPETSTHARPPSSERLVVELQSTAVALASLEIRHGIEQACLGECRPSVVKQSLSAEREREYQQARAVHLHRLNRLQEQIRGKRSPR
jgi:hypothetical protein